MLPLDSERRLEMEVFLALGMQAWGALHEVWTATDDIARGVCERVVMILG